MIKELIKEKKLPSLLSREQMLEILQREEYGYLPQKPDSIAFEEQMIYPDFCVGKATLSRVKIKSKMGEREFTFPIYATLPIKPGKHPLLVAINFSDCVPDRFMPIEELVDNGFAIISFSYKDVTSDDGDMTNGLAGVLFPDGKRKKSDPGKIAMWAWAAQRAMDYAETLDCLDLSKSAVCGHSRLGKTALLAGATDTRFSLVYSNNSGCSGAAISRGKGGESVQSICKVFPFWFCEKYQDYANDLSNMPFDQHYLMGSIAPRKIYVASANEDDWADPVHEMLGCVAASEAYEDKGLDGFVYKDRLPKVGDCFHDGNVGYHLRAGVHYLGREDWQIFARFFKKKFSG